MFTLSFIRAGYPYPRADDLEALVEEFIGAPLADAGGEVGAGDPAVAHRVQHAIAQLVHFAGAVRRGAAYTDVDNVVPPLQGAPFIDLHEDVFKKFHGEFAGYDAVVYIVAIIGIQVLIDPPERHRIAPLEIEADVGEPDQLERLGEGFWRGIRYMRQFSRIKRSFSSE